MKRQKGKQSTDEFFIEVANGWGSGVYLRPAKTIINDRLYDRSDLPEVRTKLRNLLNQIITNQKIIDSEELQYFLKIRAKIVSKYTIEKGRLVQEWTDDLKGMELLFHPIWLRNLSLNLIDYLSDSKTDLRKLKKCEWCNNFYKSKTIRPSKFCTDKCRLKWHNRKRIESGQAAEYKRRGRAEGKYQ